MQKHNKPILDVHYRHWETRSRDYCLLEGYRNLAKDRFMKISDHYITLKRPFELAVLHSAIPASEWNTLSTTLDMAAKN